MPRKKLTEEEEIARVKAMYEYEHNCRDNGYTVVAGVDEAGRGPLAGPVYAAAVILPNDIIIKGINDSKKLSEKKREELFEEITEKAIAYRPTPSAQRTDTVPAEGSVRKGGIMLEY